MLTFLKDIFQELMEIIEKEELDIHIEKAFKLERVGEAHTYSLANPDKKVVLVP